MSFLPALDNDDPHCLHYRNRAARSTLGKGFAECNPRQPAHGKNYSAKLGLPSVKPRALGKHVCHVLSNTRQTISEIIKKENLAGGAAQGLQRRRRRGAAPPAPPPPRSRGRSSCPHAAAARPALRAATATPTWQLARRATASRPQPLVEPPLC